MSSRVITHASTVAPAPQQNAGLLLQRKCAGCGNHTGGGQCTGCAKKEEEKLQRRAAGIETTTEIPPIVHEVLNSPGQPLDTATRAFMQSRFHQDFSQVRVHADAKAVESARAVNAHAFTVGSHIVFDAGQYAPTSTAGKNLLAHELTHVLQQSHGLTRSATFGIGPANDEHERQADAVANAVASMPAKPAPVTNVRPLIPGTQQTVARNDAPPPPPRTRLQRRTAEDDLFDSFAEGESQPADGGGTTTAPEKPQCPKVPTKRGDVIPVPMCPTATHTGLSEMNRFNFCLDSDELTDPSQLNGIPTAIGRTRRSARFLIHGYASPEGRRDYNFRLACHRATKIANEFRKALRTRLANPNLSPQMLEAEVESRIETASQGPTSEFGKAEQNRVAIVFEQVADKADPEPACKAAPRKIGDIKPEVECDEPTKDLLHMSSGPQFAQFHFCLDSDVMTESDPSDVRSFAQRQAASATFFVHGFASVEGTSDYNQRLSCHRALRIFRELINAGVKQEQIVEVSGLGETDLFGDPEFNRFVNVFAEGGDVGKVPAGTRKTDDRKAREAVRDEAVARIMAGKYNLAADAYISFWTCGRTATVRQAVERLRIEVKDDDKTETLRDAQMGTEEGFGVNFIRLSNAALRADNSIECTMGRIIDSAFHHAVMTGDLPTRVPDPNALPSDLTGANSGARHRAGLHLIHLAGLTKCVGRNLEPRIGRSNEPIGIDLPREKDPREGFVPNCAEAPQPTRLHPPAAGTKGREVPEFELVGEPTYTPNRGKLKSNFEPKPDEKAEADVDPESKSKGDVITTPDKDMLTASATVQLKGQKDTFKDYEVGFIQSVIADEVQADYDSGESVIQKLPTPIRLAHMKGEPRVPAPWTSASSFARPDADGKVSLTAGASGLNMEAAVALRRIDFQLPNSAVHSLEQGSRIAIWLIARRLGAPLDRFSVHFLHGVFYDLTQLAHLEHRRVFGELDQTEPQALREHELAVVVGSFLSSKPSLPREDPSSARLTGAVASEIGLFNQVRDVTKARAPRATDMDKTQLRAVVIEILDNLQVFKDDKTARAGKDGRRMPRLGFDFIPLTIKMPFVRQTGRLVNPDKKELVITVTGPGLGFDAGQAIAEALEFRIRDRASEGKDVVLRREFIPGKDKTGDVTMTIAPIPRARGADPKTDPNVLLNPEIRRSMAEAWSCTLRTKGFLFEGVEFCRAFWMDREKQLRPIPEDRLVRGESKVSGDGITTSECQLPCLLAEAGTTAGVRLVAFHTHPEPSPEPSEADLKHARDCGAPTNFIITDNQAFRFTKDGLVDEDPTDLPKGVPCDPKNLEGFVQPPE
ncbi:MAG TPA: DUF4157 domain-containing protein [Pyrinomonadaceae bacterium]|nr:DUF4157 domain-containing protein [Pyrinomonadaceae bacterium]